MAALGLQGCQHLKDLRALKGMPITNLDLRGCTGIKDLTPLAECKELVTLFLPAHCKGKLLDPIRLSVQAGNLPNLKFLDYTDNKPLPVEEFWKKHGGAAPVKK
ncbi:MAG: hypothetical protein HY360_25655 [Verrucomicrobia bacterium]|nr:hypothetical protein [Verrucomicrobiota bacterium]